MIPLNDNNYIIIDVNKSNLDVEDIKYQKLLKQQLFWLNSNYNQVKIKALKLYELYNNEKLPINIRNRCCDFNLLEEKCKKYKK